MQYKVALEMIQEVVERKDADDVEKTIVEVDKEEEVTASRDGKMSADDFLRDRKRRDQGDRTKRNSPKRGR